MNLLSKITAVASTLATASDFNTVQTNSGKELQPKTVSVVGSRFFSIPSTGYVHWSAGSIYYDGATFTLSAGSSGADWRSKIIVATLSGGTATLSAITFGSRIQDETILKIAHVESDGIIRTEYNDKADCVPIGTVCDWLKSLSGTPALGVNWVECNGQTISDSQSVYNGVAIPDLNGNNQFLYGSSTSGTTKNEDYLPSHTHGLNQEGTNPRVITTTASGSVSYTLIVSATSGTAWKGYSTVKILKIK